MSEPQEEFSAEQLATLLGLLLEDESFDSAAMHMVDHGLFIPGEAVETIARANGWPDEIAVLANWQHARDAAERASEPDDVDPEDDPDDDRAQPCTYPGCKALVTAEYRRNTGRTAHGHHPT